MELNKYHIIENGVLMDGTGRVTIPECYIYANSYQEAVDVLNYYLRSKTLPENIQLITPIEKIAFE